MDSCADSLHGEKPGTEPATLAGTDAMNDSSDDDKSDDEDVVIVREVVNGASAPSPPKASHAPSLASRKLTGSCPPATSVKVVFVLNGPAAGDSGGGKRGDGSKVAVGRGCKQGGQRAAPVGRGKGARGAGGVSGCCSMTLTCWPALR